MKTYDAILIPGGGVREGGHLHTWVQCRLDRAIKLHRGEYFIVLSAGTTYHPPPLDAGGFPIFESVAAARYLMEAGVPPDRILTDTSSYDTIGNAYFSRVIHVEPQGLRRLLVINSEFHMPRTKAVFQWLYGLEPHAIQYELEFESVTDASMPPDLLADRLEKECKSLEHFETIARQIKTMKDCHKWLFTVHDAYNATRRAFRTGDINASVLRSY
jgi:DUF218 domain